MPSYAPRLHTEVVVTGTEGFTNLFVFTLSDRYGYIYNGSLELFVAGCTNSHYTQRSKPELKYYRVPKAHRDFYNAFFKTDKVSWNHARICSSHWSTPRRDCNHLPDVRLVKPDKPKRTQTPYQRAERRNRFIRKQVNKSEKQIVCATEASAAKDIEIEQLKNELLRVKQQNKDLTADNHQLQNKVESLSLALADTERNLSQANTTINALKHNAANTKSFSWKDIDAGTFNFLTGLTVSDFTSLFQLFVPFLQLLKYEGCKLSDSTQRKISKENELFCVLLMLRHGVEEGIVSWIVRVKLGFHDSGFLAA